jgi:hypothetical protein
MTSRHAQSKAYIATSSEIQKAVEELNSVANPNVYTYCNDRNLPYQRVLRAYKGSHNRSTRPSTNKLLTPEQEKALYYYCTTINDIRFSITQDMVR